MKSMENKPFPYKEVFPKALAALIEQLESFYGFAASYSSVSFLVAFGAVVGNTTLVRYYNNFYRELRPLRCADWKAIQRKICPH